MTIAPRNGPYGSALAVTDAEIEHALSWLKRYPSGLTRSDLERIFGSDRRGRDVLAALAEQGIAAIVVVHSASHGAKVYRVARNAEELEAEEKRLRAYEESTRRRREGVRRAYDRAGSSPTAPQAPLIAPKEPPA